MDLNSKRITVILAVLTISLVLLSIFPPDICVYAPDPSIEQQQESKSLYLIADHHTAKFDAWGIRYDCMATYQATYDLDYSTDPAGIALDAIFNENLNETPTLFVTSEFSGGVEMIDATTMRGLGVSSGPSDLAGIDVDDVNDVIYAVERNSDNLYVYDWDSSSKTLTPKAGFNPHHLRGCSGAFGIALDEKGGILWVADSGAGLARAYNITSWSEIMSFAPSHKPVDITVNRKEGIVYTVSISTGANVPSGCGSNLLSKYEVATGVETKVDMGHQGIGVAVDEERGCVYVTGDGKLEVWNTSATPWTQIQQSSLSGNPAGICIPQVPIGYDELNLRKDDGLGSARVGGGDTINYTIGFDNLNNDFTIHNAVLVDMLPPETTFVSASDGGVYNAATHTVTWDIGSLSPRAPTSNVSVVARVKPIAPPEVIKNEYGISGDSPYRRIDYEKYIITNTSRGPIASFSESAHDVLVDEEIVFNASASYHPNGSITSYFWHFGDGTNDTGKIASHSYSSSGTYVVTLTVTGSHGWISVATVTLTVGVLDGRTLLEFLPWIGVASFGSASFFVGFLYMKARRQLKDVRKGINGSRRFEVICSQCKTMNAPGARFCRKCGKPL